MKKVFVINGPARVGKDTLIEMATHLLADKMGVFTYSAVDEVKQYLKDVEGWDGVTKDAYWRNRMYLVKMQMVADGDRPTQYLKESAESTPDNSVVFLHIREPDEIAKLLRIFPEAQTIHLMREGIEEFDNPADAETLKFDYNYYLYNKGSLAEFTEVVRAFLLEVLKGEIDLGEQMGFDGFI